MTGVTKRSVLVAGHSTSVSLEEPFWDGLRMIASSRRISMNKLVAEIDSTRGGDNLSSALRLTVLDFYKNGHHRTVSGGNSGAD